MLVSLAPPADPPESLGIVAVPLDDVVMRPVLPELQRQRFNVIGRGIADHRGVQTALAKLFRGPAVQVAIAINQGLAAHTYW